MSKTYLSQYIDLLDNINNLVLSYEKSIYAGDEKEAEIFVENIGSLFRTCCDIKIDIRSSELTNADKKEEFKKLKNKETLLKRKFNSLQLELEKEQHQKTQTDNKDIILEEDIMVHGRNVQKSSIQHLNTIIKITTDTNAIATDTALKIAKQGEQMQKISNDVDEIESELDRAVKVIKRTMRGVATNKFLWVLIGLIVVGIGAIIVMKIV